MYRTAAENFWRIVTEDHTYANGGNSQAEHFHQPGTLHAFATNGETQGYGENSTSEGCNEYNLLKLTRAALQADRRRALRRFLRVDAHQHDPRLRRTRRPGW